jgi:serine protease
MQGNFQTGQLSKQHVLHRTHPRPRLFTATLAVLALTAAPAVASPAGRAHDAALPSHVPGQVVVGYQPGADSHTRAVARAAAGTAATAPADDHAQVVRVTDGKSVLETARELAAQPGVAYAVPNVVARAAFVPNDPGRSNGGVGGWQQLQWNFLAGTGVNAPGAWDNLMRARKPGGQGVLIGVLDTGVAFENRAGFRRSPDFIAQQFVQGYDFVGRDKFPDDDNGHGTFVAGVIAERANNGIAATGLAYGAKILAVRVLDRDGLGDAATIAKGIRYAANRGAQVINLSLEFDPSVRTAQIPEVLSAVRYANRKGVVVVGASGNEGVTAVAYPAKASTVIAVGATTEHGCLADYSNQGRELDIVAPGGGADADLTDPGCAPSAKTGRDIFQLTYTSAAARTFGFPTGYEGTSMAAPHVAAAAALVIASGVIGAKPSPAAVLKRLQATAHDLGAPGNDPLYGAGLLDVAAATAPAVVTPAKRK